MRMMILAVVVLASSMGSANAQMSGMDMKPGAALAGKADVTKALDAMLTTFEKEVMGVAQAMPAEKYDFSPASLKIVGAQFDGVKTFGQQATHIAQANYYFFSTATGMKPAGVDVRAIGNLKTKDEIVAALAASIAFGHKAIATITAANALEVLKGDDAQTRVTLAAGAVAHGFDHYGQMVEYLRMNGIVPPASAK